MWEGASEGAVGGGGVVNRILRRIREGSLNFRNAQQVFRNAQQVATACGTSRGMLDDQK